MAKLFSSDSIDSKSYRSLFHKQISKWESGIPIQTSWVARFSLQSNIDFSSFYESIGADISMDSDKFGIQQEDQFKVFNDDLNNSIGCFYIQGIKLPVDSFNVADANLDGAGGFLTGIVGADRVKNTARSLTIDFFETNLDFIDLVIRPWMVTAAYRGLLARKFNNFKSNIDVVQFTRYNTNKDARLIRKHHQFFDCVPYSIPGNQLNYSAEDVKSAGVQWIYNTYSYNNTEHTQTESETL